MTKPQPHHRPHSVIQLFSALIVIPVFLSNIWGDPKIKLNGEYLKAFLAAYSSFKDDPLIPDQKKPIENYQIEFRQRGEFYFVLFFAKRKSTERELDGGESELGKDVMYTISKTDFKIVDKKFYK